MMCAASYATRPVPGLLGALILSQNDADVFGRRAECRSGTAIMVEMWARCQQLGAWNAGWASILGDMKIAAATAALQCMYVISGPSLLPSCRTEIARAEGALAVCTTQCAACFFRLRTKPGWRRLPSTS